MQLKFYGIVATIYNAQENQCLPYAGFFFTSIFYCNFYLRCCGIFDQSNIATKKCTQTNILKYTQNQQNTQKNTLLCRVRG